MEAVILAGGFGTRLRELGLDVPKPMVEVGGRPFLEHLLLYLRHQGVERVILATGYKKELVRQHFGELFRGMWIDYSEEEEPLGTGGAIRQALGRCEEERVWILNGDTFFGVDLPAMYAFHHRRRAFLTLAGKRMDHPGRYGLVITDGEGRILAFREKDPAATAGTINGGLYLLERRRFLDLPLPQRFSFEKDFLEARVEKDRFFLFPSEGYFIDIGIPADLERARRESEIFRRYEEGLDP